MNNFGMIVKSPGRQATRMEQILLSPLVIENIGSGDRAIIHHITTNTAYKLQLEVELYSKGNVSFHRVTL